MSLNPPRTTWVGCRVWIIGGSTGIGRACAVALHAAGAKVAVSARNAAALAELARTHPGLLALPMDLNDLAAVSTHLQTLISQWGGLDYLLFAAGTYTPTRAWDLSPARIDEMMNVNLISTMKATAIVLPVLRAQGYGHLSFISSVAGYRGLPKALVYGPSKAALIHFAESLYLDVRRLGLGVSVINPGFVRTPLTAQNDFKMPALIEPEEAAREILAGWARGAFEIHFPRRFTRVLKCLRWWPDWLYFQVMKRLA